MEHRPDPMAAGRQLLELQLSMMKGAMALMAGSAQRFVALSLAAAPAQRTARPQPRVAPATQPATASTAAGTVAEAPSAKPARPAPTRREYALRLQQDMDSILHAFAMVPDAADRLIRTSALLADRPAKGTEPRAPAPARRAPARRAAKPSADHAR